MSGVERLEQGACPLRQRAARAPGAGEGRRGGRFLEHRLAEQIDAAIVQNDYRAANIRAGYVYVISNVGAFGRRVVKIGMTRRLDSEDR